MSRIFPHDLSGATAVAGHFELEGEHRLTFEGREILYLIGNALVDTACCGVSGCRYAVVPGFVLTWHAGTNADGVTYSEVEPVPEGSLRRAITRAIGAEQTVSQVVYW